ncbi:MAG TPA: hypothetical protein VIS76_01345 [Pseudomonadales bacterium]
MGFISFLVLLAIAYLLWRVTDQLPDLIFRMSEIQRDVAEIRRAQSDAGEPARPPSASAAPSATSTPASSAGPESGTSS